jgi:ribosome-binding factor A
MQANSRRVLRVTKQMERTFADLLVSDRVVSEVVTNNHDGQTICTCSGVEVSGDLQVVKVYLLVFSQDPGARYRIMDKLRPLNG